jgi:DNA-directed RNA polymerase specialized sigma24 family protein
MDAQTRRVSERAQYFFDGATEAGEMDTGTSLCLMLYGDRGHIDEIIVGATGDWRSRLNISEALMTYADQLLPGVQEPRRGELIAVGVSSLNHHITSLAQVLGSWVIEDIVEGGCLEAFRRGRQIRSKEGHGGRPWKRWDRRLHSRKWIKRYTRRDNAAALLREMATRTLARRAMTGPLPAPDAATIFQEISLQAPAPALPEDAREAMEWEAAPDVVRDVLVRLKPGVLRRARAERKARQKTMKRAARIAVATLGPELTSAVVHKQEIAIAGAGVLLALKPIGRLASVGHGAVLVAVKASNGVLLANLCVYFEATPMLDQIVAFALYMQAGLEAEIIAAANLTYVAPDGVGHPLFADRHRREMESRPPAVEDHDAPRRFLRPERDYDRQRRRNEAYYAETRAIWETELGIFVMGRFYTTRI